MKHPLAILILTFGSLTLAQAFNPHNLEALGIANTLAQTPNWRYYLTDDWGSVQFETITETTEQVMWNLDSILRDFNTVTPMAPWRRNSRTGFIRGFRISISRLGEIYTTDLIITVERKLSTNGMGPEPVHITLQTLPVEEE